MEKPLVIAAALTVVGLILFVSAMATCQWDFDKLSTTKYETNSYEITDDFHSLLIDTDTADLTFVLSDDTKCTVQCYEEEKANHSVTVQEHTLVIRLMENRAWYDYIGIRFSFPKITVCLPQTQYYALAIQEDTGDIVMPSDFQFADVDISLDTGDVDFCSSASGRVKIKTSTGSIRAESLSAGALDLHTSTGSITLGNATCLDNITLEVSTGKTHLDNVTCKNLISDGDTGSITLKNVVATEKFSIERSTGNVRFDECDAAEIFVETDTGHVKGTLLTGKVFLATTDTGRIDVPKSATGGKCEIATDTGNIQISITNQ